MLNAIQNFCIKHKKGINNAFAVILFLYFVVVFLPNISGTIPGLNLINQGVIKIAYRVFFAILFSIYMLMCFLANEIKISHKFLSIFCFLTFIIFLSFLINIKSQIVITPDPQYADQYARMHEIRYSLGLINALSYIGDELFVLVLFFAMCAVFPTVLRETKWAMLPFYGFLLIMLILVAYTFMNSNDLEGYKRILHLNFASAYAEDMKSLFPSKNAYGLFLMESVLISGFLYSNSHKKLFLISMMFFYVASLFPLMKSGILCSTVFILILWFKNLLNFKKHKVFNIVTLSIFGVLLLTLIFIFIVGPMNKVSAVTKLYNFIVKSETSSDSRTYLVDVFFNYTKTVQMFFGYSYTLGPQIFCWTKMLDPTNAPLDNLHNTFLMVYGSGGIFYLIVYVGIMVYVLYRIYRSRTKLPMVFFSHIGMIVAFVILSFFESQPLFLSGSSGSFLISVILLSYDEKVLLKTPVKIEEEVRYETYEI